ncbi:TIGR02569 family protein [Corynebacterium caspium]|uniref:TIGR02569 family protein n=1 Tax=Corynebacterium caspium TaxID=234828 RepID=UPI00037CA0A0|nr:TIGR02569 family protein [Corynebacterium caspium]WKD59692.1 hypothetical protein CCASP_06565 [Corynebacterium caspium DSM 44850]
MADQNSTPAGPPAGPPPQVIAAFHAEPGPKSGANFGPEALGAYWDYGWRVGTLVISPVVGEHGAWSARVREKLQVEGLRIARPVRSSDGRVTVGGWRASSFIPGRPEARIDETVAAALRLGEALAQVREWPTMNINDPLAKADRAAWALHPTADIPLIDEIEDGLNVDLLKLLAPHIQALPHTVGPDAVCHAAMLATTIYQGLLPPAITDVVGVVRPRDYTAALTIVDGLLADAVDFGIISRFDHIPGLWQLILRGCAYRIYANSLLPTAVSNMGANLDRVVRALVSA